MITESIFRHAAARPAATPPPLRLTLPAGPKPRDGRPPGRRGSVFFVGTATVILRYGGFTLLTDPNFLHQGDHVHLGYGLRSKRLTEPAISLEQLPPVDLVLLSHYHGDHFDQLVEARLERSLPIATTPHAARKLRRHGFSRVIPLRTWQRLEVGKGDSRLRLTALPGRHGPGLLAKALPPVMGSLLEFAGAEGGDGEYRIYISGDTLAIDELKEIPRRFPDIDLALLHLGGTRILGVLVTMDARQGVAALELIRPGTAIPIHYDDYTVFKSPLVDFLEAARAAGLDGRIRVLKRGQLYEFSPRR